MTRALQTVLALLLALGISRSTAAQTSSDATRDMGEFDCVIEPKIMTKLGSPDTGIIQSVMVDRDRVVEKGDVVAQLDSDLQRSALDLARLQGGKRC